MNNRNFVVTVGRLTKDPVKFDNKDGSKKVMFTVAAQDNFTSRDGKKATQFIPLEAYVSAERIAKNNGGLGVYDLIHKGDLITAVSAIKSNTYTDKNGETQYATAIQIESIDLMESKTTTDARLAQAQTAEAPAEGDVELPA